MQASALCRRLAAPKRTSDVEHEDCVRFGQGYVVACIELRPCERLPAPRAAAAAAGERPQALVHLLRGHAIAGHVRGLPPICGNQNKGGKFVLYCTVMTFGMHSQVNLLRSNAPAGPKLIIPHCMHRVLPSAPVAAV